MKNILVPTNFNQSSLDCIPALCNQFKGEKLSFFFVHVFKLSDSITDLLMLSRRSKEYEFVSEDFYNACAMLKRNYPQLSQIKIDFLYGSTLSMFKTYLEGNDINHVLELSSCSLGKINKASLDQEILVKRSGLPLLFVSSPAIAEPKTSVTIKINQEELVAI